jgi:hypothetical protein
MGDNLVGGILKNIENLANVNVQQNIAILTNIKKTNTILSQEIGTELKKQTKLLQSIAESLAGGKAGGFSLFSTGGNSLAKLFKKKGPTIINKLSKSIDTLTVSITKFAVAVDGLDEKKLDAFTKLLDINIGKKILLFATLTATAAPLLVISLLSLGILFLWTKFFSSIGKNSKFIQKGVKELMFMAIATALITVTVLMAAFALGDPLRTIAAFLVVAGSLLLLAGAFLLISKIDKSINQGTRTMLFAALTTAIIVGIIIIASYLLGDPGKTFMAFLVVAGAVLILGLTFLIIGKMKGQIIQGAIAMIIASIAVGIILFSVVKFSKANVTWEDIAKIGALVVGLGAAMAAAGFGAILIGLGAGVMLIASAALYVITKSLLNFKEAEWTSENDKQLKNSLMNIVDTFSDVFSSISPMEMIKMLAGAALLGAIGNSLSAFAQGLNAFANAQAPEYEVKDGKLVLVGTNPIDANLGKRVGDTIKALISPLIDKDAVLYNLGKDQGWFFDGPVGNGIDLLGRLGNSLGNFAMGLQNMANLYVPTYGVNEKGELVVTKVDKIDDDFGEKLAINIKKMVDVLIDPLSNLGENEGMFFDGPVGNGIDLLGRLGNSLGNFAKGLQNMANLYIPTYGVNEKGEMVVTKVDKIDDDFGEKLGVNIQKFVDVLIDPLTKLGQNEGTFISGDVGNGIKLLGKLGNSLGTFAKGIGDWADLQGRGIPVYKVVDGELTLVDHKPLDSAFATNVGKNINMIVESLTKPLEELGSKSGTFSDSDYETGLDMLAKLGTPIESLANAASKLAKIKVEPKKLEKTVKGTITAFVSALSKSSLKNLDEANGKKVLDGFDFFAKSVGKIGKGDADKVSHLFVTMKDSINGMDMQKLKKLNGLAFNLRKFAESMKGSFGDLENVLERFVEVLNDMNDITTNPTPTKRAETIKTITNDVKVDLVPLLDELDSIKSVLLAGIEVEVKDSMLAR